MRELIVLLLAGSSVAMAQVDVPRIGFVRNQAGEIYRLNGLAGAAVVEAVEAAPAEYAAFSGTRGVWKTSERLIVTTAEGGESASREALPGGALAAFNVSGEEGIVWLRATRELLRFPGWESIEQPEWRGEPVAMAVVGTRLRTVVRREDGLWLVDSSLQRGSVILDRLLPGVQEPVFLASEGLVLSRGEDAVIVTDSEGGEERIALDGGPAGFEAAGKGWVAVRSGERLYVLRLENRELIRVPAARRNP